MAAPICDACEGTGIVTVWGRTSAPVASPPEVQQECGDCEGSGKDWERTCENCGEEHHFVTIDGTRYCRECLKEEGERVEDSRRGINPVPLKPL